MNQLDKIIYKVTKILKLRQRSRAFRYLSSFMGCAVVFATTYSLILPAITIEYETASEMSGIYLEDSAGVSADNTDLVTDGFEASPDTDLTGTLDLTDASDQTSLSDQAYTSDQASPSDPAYTSDQDISIGAGRSVESDRPVRSGRCDRFRRGGMDFTRRQLQ